MNSLQSTAIEKARSLARVIASTVARDRHAITEHEILALASASLEELAREADVEIDGLRVELSRVSEELRERSSLVVQLQREGEAGVRALEIAGVELAKARDMIVATLSRDPLPLVRKSSVLTLCDGSGRFLANVIDPRSYVAHRQLVECFGCERCKGEVRRGA